MATISRRSFIAAGAMGAAAAALPGLASADEAPAYDVIVIGGGGAGLSAAIEAADAGAQVLLLEKNVATGGATSTSQGRVGGYGTQIQKAQGVEITYEQMYDNLDYISSYRLDPELMGITVAKSGESVDWLIDRCAVPFQSEAAPFQPDAAPTLPNAASDQPDAAPDQPDAAEGDGPLEMMHIVEGAGAALTDALLATATEAGVEVLTEARATSILMEDGVLSGVQTEDGTTYSCKALVVATGGYAYNPELAARFTPEVAGTLGIGHPMSCGEGIVMASNVGACTSHTDSMMCVLKDYEIMTEHTPTSAAANVNGFTSLPNMIMVGAQGTRFYNEDGKGYMSQDLNRPVFDQMHKDKLGYVWMVSDQAAVDATEGKTHRGEDLAYVAGETVEELAANMGVDAEGLAATVEAYNAAVDAGSDAGFGLVPTAKLEAPFVALAVTPCVIITYGGIARNADSQAIRADGTAVEGLYCAGETSCNSAFMGFTISNAITWGRIAGANAAAHAAA